MSFGRLRQKIVLKSVLRAARLFFLIQPMTSMFSGVVGDTEFNWLNKMNKKK